MALHALNPPDDDSEQDPCTLAACPVCSGQMEVAYDRYQQKVCVCVDCHAAVTIPGSAWEIAKSKHAAKRAGSSSPPNR